jgi:hypothetical protein
VIRFFCLLITIWATLPLLTGLGRLQSFIDLGSPSKHIQGPHSSGSYLTHSLFFPLRSPPALTHLCGLVCISVVNSTDLCVLVVLIFSSFFLILFLILFKGTMATSRGYTSDGEPSTSNHHVVTGDTILANKRGSNTASHRSSDSGPTVPSMAHISRRSHYQVPKTLFQGQSHLDSFTRSTMVSLSVVT